MINLERCKTCNKLSVSGETVVISVSEYEDLKRLQEQQILNRSISAYRSISRSGIGLNPELAEFILDRVPTMTIKMLHQACQERFGDSCPSRSSIFRFVQKMAGGR